MKPKPNRSDLVQKLKSLGAFWSYSPDNLSELPDNVIIEEGLRWGDVSEIQSIFKTFSPKQIKQVWREKMLPDERIYSHNYYLAAIFFDIKNPARYIKPLQKKYNRYALITKFAS